MCWAAAALSPSGLRPVHLPHTSCPRHCIHPACGLACQPAPYQLAPHLYTSHSLSEMASSMEDHRQSSSGSSPNPGVVSQTCGTGAAQGGAAAAAAARQCSRWGGGAGYGGRAAADSPAIPRWVLALARPRHSARFGGRRDPGARQPHAAVQGAARGRAANPGGCAGFRAVARWASAGQGARNARQSTGHMASRSTSQSKAGQHAQQQRAREGKPCGTAEHRRWAGQSR